MDTDNNTNTVVDDTQQVQDENPYAYIKNLSYIEQVIECLKIFLNPIKLEKAIKYTWPDMVKKYNESRQESTRKIENRLNKWADSMKAYGEKLQQENLQSKNYNSSNDNKVNKLKENLNELKSLSSELETLQPSLEIDAIKMDYAFCLKNANYEGALENISELIRRVPNEYPDAYAERAKVKLFLMDVSKNYNDMQVWHEVFSDLNTSNDIEQGNYYMGSVLLGAIFRLKDHLPHETPEEIANLITEVTEPIPQDSLFEELIKALYYATINPMEYGVSIRDNLNKIINNESTIPLYRYIRCFFFQSWLIGFCLYVSVTNPKNDVIDEEFMKNIREDVNIINEIESYRDVPKNINHYLNVLMEQYCNKAVGHLKMYLQVLNILEQFNRDMEYHLAHWQDGLESDGYDKIKNIVETTKQDIENANISFIIDSENSYAQATMGLIKFIYGKNTDALEFLNKALETSDNNIYGYVIRGIVYKALGQYDNAMKDFELVLSSDAKGIDKDLISEQIKLIEGNNQHQQIYNDMSKTKQGRELDI